MGLRPIPDRLCLVQLSAGDGSAHLVQFAPGKYDAPNLARLLTDPETLKLFHFARFDVAVLQAFFGAVTAPIYCTKIASKLVCTYHERPGLKDLCRDLLGIEVSQVPQSSDCDAAALTVVLQKHAARSEVHTHELTSIMC